MTGSSRRQAERRSLDLVQRWVISVIMIVVGGSPTVALAVAPHFGAGASGGTAVGICVLSGVIGALTALAVLLIHRVRGWGLALVAVGLLPAGLSAFLLLA